MLLTDGTVLFEVCSFRITQLILLAGLIVGEGLRFRDVLLAQETNDLIFVAGSHILGLSQALELLIRVGLAHDFLAQGEAHLALAHALKVLLIVVVVGIRLLVTQ